MHRKIHKISNLYFLCEYCCSPLPHVRRCNVAYQQKGADHVHEHTHMQSMSAAKLYCHSSSRKVCLLVRSDVSRWLVFLFFRLYVRMSVRPLAALLFIQFVSWCNINSLEALASLAQVMCAKVKRLSLVGTVVALLLCLACSRMAVQSGRHWQVVGLSGAQRHVMLRWCKWASVQVCGARLFLMLHAIKLLVVIFVKYLFSNL